MTTSEDVYFERLTGLDAAFLAAERDGVHMHVAALMCFSKCDLCREDGGVDFEALRGHALDMIEGEPRLRQRLAWTPVLHHPYWVDDPGFRLNYHLRHTALPRPGDERQLKRLMGRVLSQPLDRSRPLWEQWVVEGLQDGGFAVMLKFHHCVLDGMGAMGLLARLVAGVPGRRKLAEARPMPSPMQLLQNETRHRGQSLASLKDLGADADDPSGHTPDQREMVAAGRAFADVVLNRAPRTRLNPRHVSGHRRFDVLSVPFEGIRAVKKAEQATVNDVVLAIVTEGLRRYLARTGVDPATLKPFRALVPATTRAKSHERKLGNEVAMMMADLPMDEPDPLAQLRSIRHTTEYLKDESHEVDGGKWLSQLDDRLGLGLMGNAFRWSGHLRAFNVIVTNVPGPPVPVKVFGAPLRALYGAVPLTEQTGLGITLFSYAGQLHFGLQADRDALEDLYLLVRDLREAHDTLCEASKRGSP